MVSTRHSLKLLVLLAAASIVSLEPLEQGYGRYRPAPPAVPYDPPEMRPAPERAAPLKAAAGGNGPEARGQEAGVLERETVRRPATVDAARQAARQRYLDQVYLLSRLIHGEARGEPYLGQVAVGAVVLNRVQSPLFPKTIAGVIYQPGAFDAVSDGQINLPPDRDSVRAAKAAISGWDPTGGALFYYNPAKATSYWIWRRPVVLVIGRHHFAR